MRIAFLLPVVSDARYHKRVESLKRLGVQPQILAFERDYYAGKPWPDGHMTLGHMEHGHYWRRIAPLLQALPDVRSAVRDSDVVYTFGLDMLALGWLASHIIKRSPELVYEVADLGVLTKSGVFYDGIRALERYLLRHIRLLVVTSQAYIDGYYSKVHDLNQIKYQVIENKLVPHTTPHPLSETYQASDEICIGYFGVIRCLRSWQTLVRTAQQANGKIRVYVRGIPLGIDSFHEDVENNPHIVYDGPYVSPDELPAMYDRVDAVWLAHYMGPSSLSWNRANRFYEACFYRRPMIAQVGTQDGEIVKSKNLGINIDLADIDASVEQLFTIKKQNLSQWQQNVVDLPRHIYIYTDEHIRLLDSLFA